MKKNKILVVTPTEHISGLNEKMKKKFDVCYLHNPTENEFLEKSKDINYIFTNPNMSKLYFSEKNLNHIVNLKCICTASTGTNHIDLVYLKKKNIKLISLRKKLKIISAISSTAELAFTLMMNSLRNIEIASKSVKLGKWDYLPFIGRQMNYLTVGVIGYGRLGKIFTKFLKPFTKNIFIYESGFQIKDSNKKYQSTLQKLLKNSDIISLHIHADKKNINFINSDKLKLVKKNVLIINTSRGEIVNERDIVNFLKVNKKSRYYTDVIKDEIKDKNKSLILKEFKKNNDQIFITPHVGGMTSDAQYLAYNGVLEDLIKFDRSNF